MCRFAYGHRRGMRDAQTFFTIVLAMIREAIAVLAQARRDLEEIARNNAAGTQIKPGFALPAQTHTETHLNVPL